MTFLNLCSNSLILSVAFTLLISGLIVFLMNTKISRVEKNIQKQNQALSDMINLIQSDINVMGNVAPSEFMVSQNSQSIENDDAQKIQVSDDSDDSGDSDSDTDTDSETESDEEHDDTPIQNKEISVNRADTLKTINLSTLSDISNKNEDATTTCAIEELPKTPDVSETSSSDDDDSSDDDNPISTIQLQEVLDKVSSDKIIQEVSVVKVDSDEPDKSSNGAKQPGLTKLKVTDLKDLVLNDNLASPSKVAEMKKKELIELLRMK